MRYQLHTHTVDGVPMELVASFHQRSTERAFRASEAILYSEEGQP